MGSWAYCRHPLCDRGLPKPTPREVIDGEQLCCDGHRNPATMTMGELVIELAERVEELETKVARCATKAW